MLHGGLDLYARHLLSCENWFVKKKKTLRRKSIYNEGWSKQESSRSSKVFLTTKIKMQFPPNSGPGKDRQVTADTQKSSSGQGRLPDGLMSLREKSNSRDLAGEVIYISYILAKRIHLSVKITWHAWCAFTIRASGQNWIMTVIHSRKKSILNCPFHKRNWSEL